MYKVIMFFEFLNENKEILKNLDIHDLSFETVENKLVPLAKEHGFNIKSKDIFRFINEYSKKNLGEINDEILDKVSGGKASFNKAMAASLLVLIGGITMFGNTNQTYAVNSDDSYISQNKNENTDVFAKLKMKCSKNKSNSVRLQDDFYATVNQIWLKNTKIPDGKAANSTFNQVDESNEKIILNILKELSSKENKKGSPEQKLSDFYKSVIDLKNREVQRINPIKKYINLYDNAQNLQELLQADLLIFEQTGGSILIGVSVTPDAKDSNKNILEIGSLTSHLAKHTIDSEKASMAYTDFIRKLLELSGESSSQAQIDAQKITKFEHDLSNASMEQNELYDIDKTYNVFSANEINKEYPDLNLPLYLKSFGIKDVPKINISDRKLFNKAYEYFKEENFSMLKLYAKTRTLIRYGRYLSKDFTDAIEDLNKALFGIEGKIPIEKKAARAVETVLSDDLGKIFIEKHFSEKAKKDIENMILKIKESYKDKIKNATWLSNQTKEKAIKKLETMKLKIGYPEKWDDVLDNADIKSYKDGGSYFSNICEVQRKMLKKCVKKLSEPVDKTQWEMAVYTVNAYYNPQNNEIVFPAGILQNPFYDINASQEQNMGAIGAVIAHEISHAFDNSGSKFDENGNAVNWWTEEDRKNFDERCEKIVQAYNGIEILEDTKSNGKLTLFENIADIGAISCMLDILSKKENPDYQTFFKSWATTWRMVASPEFKKQLSNLDVHSESKIRTNRTLANFEEFHKAFNITPGDKMYVSPENRVSLW